jgi:choline/glycine/proline betaine transport protein
LQVATWTESYTGSNWQNAWTVFYWGWWIAWSPFVGMFMLVFQKARTVREFILGVLLVPSIDFSGFQLLEFSCASSVAW